jgi:hypothetical protein
MFWSFLNWKRFDPIRTTGVKIEGDSNVRATTCWNWARMKRREWQTVAVFQVSAEDAERGFRIGYIPTKSGKSMVWKARRNSQVYHDQVYRVLVGAEACIFFATRGDSDDEVAIKLIALEGKTTGENCDKPLY